MNTANQVDYLVIGLYALLMVRVGLYVLRFNRGAAEYFRGGSRIPWLVAGLSCFMSGFSAWTFTGAAGVAYRSGIAAIGLYIGNALSFLLGYFVFAERWRRSRITTVMEYLSGRFNLATHQVFSWSTIVFQSVHQRKHLVWVEPVCFLCVRISCDLDHRRRRRTYCFLLRLRRIVGGSGHRLSASLDPDAVLSGSRRDVSRAGGGVSGLIHSLPREMKTMHVSGEFGWIYMRLVDDHGFVRLQHQRDGATLFQRR